MGRQPTTTRGLPDIAAGYDHAAGRSRPRRQPLRLTRATRRRQALLRRAVARWGPRKLHRPISGRLFGAPADSPDSAAIHSIGDTRARALSFFTSARGRPRQCQRTVTNDQAARCIQETGRRLGPHRQSISTSRGAKPWAWWVPAGAGRTTLLEVLATVMKPILRAPGNRGRRRDPPSAMQARNKIGYAAQSPDFLDDLTVGEYLAFIAHVHACTKRQRAVRRSLLQRCASSPSGRTPRRERCPEGQKQALAVTVGDAPRAVDSAARRASEQPGSSRPRSRSANCWSNAAVMERRS